MPKNSSSPSVELLALLEAAPPIVSDGAEASVACGRGFTAGGRRLKRRVLKLGGCLASLCLLAVVGYGLAVKWEKFIPHARSIVVEGSDMTLEVNGGVYPEFAPMPRLTARAVRLLPEHGGGEPVVRAQRAYITFSPLSWISGGAFLNLHLDNPTIHVVRNEEGHYNLETLMRSLQGNLGARRTTGFLPSLRSVVIVKGRFFYSDFSDGNKPIRQSLFVQDGTTTWYPRKGHIESSATKAEYKQRFYRYDIRLREARPAKEVFETEGKIQPLHSSRNMARTTLFEGNFTLKPNPVARLTAYDSPLF